MSSSSFFQDWQKAYKLGNFSSDVELDDFKCFEGEANYIGMAFWKTFKPHFWTPNAPDSLEKQYFISREIAI